MRIDRTDSTWPNVGELTTVSMVPQTGVLSTLLASTRSVSARLPPSGMSRESAALSWRDEGPMMVLRAAVPNAPVAGIRF